MTTIRDEAADRSSTSSRALWMVRLAAALAAVGAVAVVALGISLVLEDMSTRGEWFDGFGIFIGLVFCGVGVVLAVPALFAAWLADRRPFPAALVVGALGVLVAGVGGVALSSLGEIVSAAVVLGGVVMGVLGFGAALVARPGR